MAFVDKNARHPCAERARAFERIALFPRLAYALLHRVLPVSLAAENAAGNVVERFFHVHDLDGKLFGCHTQTLSERPAAFL